MSDPISPTPPPPPPTTTILHTNTRVAADGTPLPLQIRVVSHSGLFYWWPVWLFGLIFALISFSDGHRMAIVPHDAVMTVPTAQQLKEDPKARTTISIPGPFHNMDETTQIAGKDSDYYINPRVAARPWMGPVFLSIIFVVMMITNVPLRGLWSLVVIISFVVIVLIISLMHWWTMLLTRFGDLHVYLNLGGYLFIGTLTLIGWLFTVLIFDNRTYIIFTAGQIKACEEVGAREQVFDTTGLTLEKQRDDWFRHIILGFGSGDLTVKTAGADRQAIKLPNVAFIGFKIGQIERLIRERQVK